MRSFVALFSPLPGNGMGASCLTVDAPGRNAAFGAAEAHAARLQTDWASHWSLEILSPRDHLTTMADGSVYAYTDPQGVVVVVNTGLGLSARSEMEVTRGG